VNRSHRFSRWLVLGALTIVVLAGAAIWRAETESTPPLRVHRMLPAFARIPGKAPAIAWPREGEATVEVDGIGSLGTVGGQKPVPIASVAKVMTAYLTLREYPLAPGEEGFLMRITAGDVREQKHRVALDESTLNVKKGELLSERQALEALMLPSANNIAGLLATYDAGGIPTFVKWMNSAAAELGMTATTYTDPSGFDAGTVSTATDQLKLARMAMRERTFAEIVDERAVDLPVVGRVINYNELVGEDGYVGVKTGSDEAAGGCLMFARRVTVGKRSLMVLGVVLGQRKGELVEAALTSARRLGHSVKAALGLDTVLPAGSDALRISNASGGDVMAATTAPLQEIGWPGLRFPVRVAIRKPGSSLQSGQRVGTVIVSGSRSVRTGARVTRSLGGPSLRWRLLHLL
jgi:serine-type D-Ala-D-Ala carboxypeptidase (penicillin-binding protein 5/6)